MAGTNFIDYKDVAWKDMRISIDGAKIAKVQGIKYKSSMKKDFLHAAGEDAVSIQAGNRENMGSIKLLKSAVDQLNLLAVAAGGKDLLDISFDIIIEYRKQANRPMMLDTLVGVEVTEYEMGMEQGATSMPVELPIMYLNKKSVAV